MKKTLSLLALFLAMAAVRGDVVKFNLVPNGLNPTNVVPAVTNSTGSGNAISGGITLQTTNSTLTFAIGYGDAAGFRNLTGPATAASLNGPAPAGSNAAVLIDLGSFAFPAVEPTNGGIIFGSIVLASDVTSNLLGGQEYIVISTESNTNGEIRGQLVPALTDGLTLVCPGDMTVECTGKPIKLTAKVASASGNALTVIWNLNGMSVQTNLVPHSANTNAVAVVLAANLEMGSNLVEVTVADDAGSRTSCDSTIILHDTVAPVITKATPFPTTLWPPNHEMVPINIVVATKEACCLENWKIIAVTSNEPVRPGNTSPDWVITGDRGLSLRAERAGNGTGRVYTITVQARDCANNLSAPVSLTVSVPHDQGKNK